MHSNVTSRDSSLHSPSSIWSFPAQGTRGGCVQVVGGVYKSLGGCTSRRWCLQVVRGVYKSLVGCTSRGGCVKVVGVV